MDNILLVSWVGIDGMRALSNGNVRMIVTFHIIWKDVISGLERFIWMIDFYFDFVDFKVGMIGIKFMPNL